MATGGRLRPYTITKLRPDYNRMISSGYALQTAENERALAALGRQYTDRTQAFGAMGRLAESYDRAVGRATTANEARYQQMLKLAEADYQRKALVQRRMLGAVGRTTQQRAADIRSAYGEQESNIMQQLARQGMAGTTVAPTMQMGVARERESALNRLSDQMLGTRLGVMRDIAGQDRSQVLGIMERRTDAYPDQTALVEAMKAMGSGYGSQGTAAAMNALSGLYGGKPVKTPLPRAGSLASRAANSSLSAGQYRAKYG